MDRRIRLGREPNRTLIWDATTVLAFEPRWLTRAVDALPLIETDALSRIEFEAEDINVIIQVLEVMGEPNVTELKIRARTLWRARADLAEDLAVTIQDRLG